MKKIENFMWTIKRNNRRLFYVLFIIALFGMVSLFLWQPSAEMQDKYAKEDFSIADAPARIDENSPTQSIKEDISNAPAAIVYTTSTMTGQTIVPGTTNVGNAGDDVTTNIALPFAFSYYGNPFASANVSSNGNLQFTSNNTVFGNSCPLPSAVLVDAIMPHWDDLRTDNAGGGIFTSVSGSAPNRIFNIEWRAIYFATTTTINFEIRLYETTGQIDYVYGALNGTGSSASPEPLTPVTGLGRKLAVMSSLAATWRQISL